MNKFFHSKALAIVFLFMYIVILVLGTMLVAMVSRENKALVKLYMFFPIISLGAGQSHFILLRDNAIEVLKKQDVPIMILMTVCSILEYFFKAKGYPQQIWLPILIVWVFLIVINIITQGYRYNTKIWRWNIVDAIKSRKK